MCITAAFLRRTLRRRSREIGNLYESLVVVNQGRQSESTDGLKGA